jgi:hypothetical protein
MPKRETLQVLAKMYQGKKPSKHQGQKDPAPVPVPVKGREGKAYVVKGLRP